MIAVNDVLAIRFEPGNRTHYRTCGDDDVFGLDRLLGSIFGRDFYFARQCQFSGTLENCGLVFLHQELDAFRVLQHHFVFSLLHIGKGELDAARLDAEIGGVLHLFVQMSGLEELFGRNTTAQCTRAAQPFVFLDDSDFQAQLSGANRGDITAWPTADYRYIKLFVSQFWKIPLRCSATCLSCVNQPAS